MKSIKLFVAVLVMALCANMSFAQNMKVQGTVKDANGEPIIGASVVLEGTQVFASTDLDGKFSISAPGNGVLVVSFVGFETQNVPVNNRAVVDVTLHPELETLEDVFVVAYGTAKKSQFTGSASTISNEKIVARQTSNITNALAGQVAGVQITSSNGQPGTEATIRIRGIGSMSASNKPLYVVDGVPFDGDVSTINPQDIASMTVLKDAASNALYGARGANGVILVTTKKGQGGQAKVNFDAKWGTNRRALPNYDVMTSPAMYYETAYTAILNALGGDPNNNARVNSYLESFLAYNVYDLPSGELLIGTDGKLNPNATLGRIYQDEYYLTPDNWYDELFDKGNLRQEYNLNVSGANDRMNYYLSVGYLDDSGIISGSGFSRFSARLKSDYQISKAFRVSANIAYSNAVSDYPADQSGSSSANLFYVANFIAPIFPLYVRNADGSIKTDQYGYTVYDYGAGEYPGLGRPFMGNSSPASQLELDKRTYNMDVISAKGSAEWRIVDGLKATANWGMDLDNTRMNELVNAFYGQYSSVGGIASVSHSRTLGINQQYLLSYIKQFGKHNVDILAGFESYKYKYQTLSGSKQNLYNPTIGELNNAINDPSTSSATTNYATQGILARVQYNYADKYFASFSYRRDASSRFHPDNRWGNFWSVGASWLMNKENFLKDASWINMLKVKASYGVQGNDNIGNYYAYMDQYSIANNNNDFAISLAYKGNKDITWETSHSFNAGVDFEFFGSRLNGTAEYFSRKTVDMLYNRPTPNSLGYSSYPMNVGSMSNNGFEVELNGTLIQSKNVTWGMNFNITHFKNKIKELHPDLNGEMISGTRIYREGESMYQFYLREYAGVDKETGEALYYKDVLDENGNVVGEETTANWSDATRRATGDILPKFYGGFGTTLNVYGIDLSVSLAYQFGGKVYDNSYASIMHAGTSDDMGHNWHKDILNAWTPENKDSNIPRLDYNAQYANSTSTRFLTSSNYLSLQNVTVGYTFPTKWVNKLGMSSLRIYAVADNVALFSKRKGFDPRQGYTASGSDVYSPIRSISGGISIQF